MRSLRSAFVVLALDMLGGNSFYLRNLLLVLIDDLKSNSDNIAHNAPIAVTRQVISHLLLTLVICILNITVGMH